MTIKHINRVERLYARHTTKEKGQKSALIAMALTVGAFILLTI